MNRISISIVALLLGLASMAAAKQDDPKPVYEAVAAHRAEAVQALGHLATAARLRYERRLAIEGDRS